MIYVVSDIHGRLDRLKRLVEVINLKISDTLYILGDMIDRGNDSIDVIKYVMNHDNIVSLMGNHERMMLDALKLNDKYEMNHWDINGNDKTKDDFYKLNILEQNKILDYLNSLEYFKIINNKFLLVHAGIDISLLKLDIEFMDFENALYAQDHELLWVRDEFLKSEGLKNYNNYTIIFGHTPRPSLNRRLNLKPELPYKIWYDEVYKNKICIDTGNCCDNGRMSCLRLDDFKEFYVE